MAKDLELKVQGDSKSATAALAAAAREMDHAAREADKMGRAFDAAKRDAEQLDRELAKNAAAVKLLAHEYATADADIRGSIKGRLDAERSAGTELQKVRRDLLGGSEKDAREAENAFKRAVGNFEKLASDAGSDGAGSLARSLGKGLSDAFESGAPEVKVAIANVVGGAAIAVAAPVAAAINGALLAGIGLAGIGLGIAGQIDNPAVQAAGKQLGADLKKQLTASTAGFEKPIIGATQILDASIGRTLGNLSDDLDQLATHLEPLARGIGSFFEKAFGGQGFADALAAAGPIIDDLAQNMDGLGQNTDRAFAILAKGSAGGKDGLDLLFLAVETLLVGVSGLIAGFSNLYHAFLAPGREALSLWDDLRGNTDGYAHSLGGATTATDEFGQSVEQGIGSVGDFKNALTNAAATVDTQWAGAIDAVVGNMLSLDKATLGWDETLTNLTESVKKNGTSLDEHTKKGQANRDTLLDGVQANLKLFDAQVASGDSAEEAGKKFQAHNDQLRAAAIAAGYNAKEVDGMIKKYGQVPPEIQTQVEMHGLQEALSNLDETLRLINHLPPRVTVDINANVHGNLFAASNAIRDILGSGYVSSGLSKRKKALGGPVKGGEPYIVGDGGRPELFIPKVDGTILPRVPQNTPVAMWGSGGGYAQTLNLLLSAAPGGDTATGTYVHSLVRGGTIQLRAVLDDGTSVPVKVL